MTLYLHIIEEAGPRQVFRLDDPATLRIGRRHDCDLQLQDRSVSRQHCRLDVHDGRVRIEDTFSRNGTYLDGERLTEPGAFGLGNVLRITNSRLELHDHPGIEPEAYDACSSPGRLVLFLPAAGGSRKLRLLACAWVRRLGLACDAFLPMIESAEAFADGHISSDELILARNDAQGKLIRSEQAGKRPARFLHLCDPWPRNAVTSVLDILCDGFESFQTHGVLMELTRDILGDFFAPFTAPAEWLCWNNRTVWKVARKIYDEQAFADLPILGDALEEAGCEEERILRHCRGAHLHARGCYVLDGILGTPRPRIADPGSSCTAPPR